ncbi:MAG: cyclopropane fatty acyl phospholipid synthase [Acidobacteriota bacterium]|nr:cyclopropane fatty acyl phospholipid synthase [Acidobacteriota bacterium]
MTKLALLQSLLEDAARLNGDAPWDIQVHDERLASRVLSGGSLALGEAYMDGWWDCMELDQLIFRVLRADLQNRIRSWKVLPRLLYAALIGRGRRYRAFEVGERHYDLGNDLYEAMLDPRMVYSCGYWEDATTLEQAQLAKLDLICRKLRLKPGMRLLDIGCGWGGLAIHAAQAYGVSAVGLTVSKEQLALAKERGKGLPVEFRLQDYRDLRESFDAVASVGMFEHVGPRFYRTFFKVVHRCLPEDGLFLLHTIGGNSTALTGDPWIEKHIFPNGLIPSIAQISAALEGLFVVEDWCNFGADYDPTLMAWHRNFEAHWDRLKSRYDERFHRKWRYYLLSCAGSFRARYNNLWQIVLTKHGRVGGYEPLH